MSLAAARVWSVAIVVPARDESGSIGECLRSILRACDACASVAAAWVVVVADDCRDETAAIARRELGSRGEVLECASRSPGSARRQGSALAMEHFRHVETERVWLANTDADTTVPADWIERHLELAARGVAAVAGIVRVESVVGCDKWTLRRLFEDYRVEEDGQHPHVHGANLGVRADAYLDSGGWSDLAVAEDHCLWRRIQARKWSTESSADSVVMTSGRLQGRAPGGFADTLRLKLERLRA